MANASHQRTGSVCFMLGAALIAPAGCDPAPEGAATVEGQLEILIADDFDRGESWMEYQLELADGRVVNLDSAVPIDVESGSTVRVNGDWMDGTRLLSRAVRTLALPGESLEQGEDIAGVQRGLIATTPMPRRTAAVLINFTNASLAATAPQTIRDKTFALPTSAKAFFKESSFGIIDVVGKTNPAGDVLGPYTVPTSSSMCATGAWASEALMKAQEAGVDTAGYDHFIFFFPKISSCRWSGLGSTGGGTMGPNNVRYGRNTWINGDGTSVISHELGHNFRISHAATNSCTSNGTRVTLSTTCTPSEYGSTFDVMGRGGLKHSGAYGKGRAGWIGTTNTLTVRKSGTYTILPIEKGLDCGTQTVRIPRVGAGGSTEYYYLDFRQPFGFDNYPATSPAINGVLIYLAPGHEAIYRNTLQLDMTPGTTAFTDAPLAVGATFADPDGKVTIKTLSAGPSGAVVEVKFPGGDMGENAGGCTGMAGPDGGVMPPDAGGGSDPTDGGAADRMATPDARGADADSDATAAAEHPGIDAAPSVGPDAGQSDTVNMRPPAQGEDPGGCGCAAGASPLRSPVSAVGLGLVLGGLFAAGCLRRRRTRR